MTNRLYFSYGVTKSGSTLAWRLTQKFYMRNGCDQPLMPPELLGPSPVNNYIVAPTAEQLEGMVRFAADNNTCLALKTHSMPTPEMADMLRSGEALGHAVFRDPREIALSLMDHGARNREMLKLRDDKTDAAFTEMETLENAYRSIDGQLKTLESWLKLPGVFPAFYDDFAFDHVPFIKRLRRQTGLKKRSVEGVLAKFDGEKRSQFNKGQPQRWREDMTDEESAVCLARYKPLYSRLIRWRKWPFTPFLRQSQTLKS